MDSFATRLLAWFDTHGRRNLPWQHPRTPYRVWLSEIMLQQTQVRTVIPYFERFVSALPTLQALAGVPLDRVLALWSGLGYYSRARNLHRSAQLCIEQHAGELPREIAALSSLPGIGRSTAAAILAQAHDLPHAILDGNVRRVLARFHGIRGWPGSTSVQKHLWLHAERHTPKRRAADYTQAIMDLGALVCVRSRPRCADCPVNADCVAARENLTAILPEAKPARRVPTRATQLLVVRDTEGRVLLERRPPTGVWARLWSLPESNDADIAIRHLAERHAIHASMRSARATFVHVFSHFRLEITPLLLHARTSGDRIGDDADLGWYHSDDLPALGLPAPVRKLLADLMKEPVPCEPCTA